MKEELNEHKDGQATPKVQASAVERLVIRAGTYFFYAGESQVVNGKSTAFHALWQTQGEHTLPEILNEIVEAREKDTGSPVVLTAFNTIDV